MRARYRAVHPGKNGSARSKRERAKISIVGAGAVGSTLGMLLFEHGYEIVSIVSRSRKPALSLAKAVRCRRVSTSLSGLSPGTEVLLFSVPDHALPAIVRRCARTSKLRYGELVTAHTSGVYTVDVLRPMEKKGAGVGSLHPVQSFPKTKSLHERMKSVRGIYFAVEGEGKAMETVQQIVHVLGGKVLRIPKELKPLYHVACVFASNYVVALLNAVAETARAAGFDRQWREVMVPLFTTVVENALKTTPRGALTGPIVRNDLDTVKLHLEALERYAPQLIPLYSIAGIETARIARQSDMLSSGQFRRFVGLIRRHVRSHTGEFRSGKEKH